MANFLDFLSDLAKENDEDKLQESIRSFVNAVVTTELLGVSHDGDKLLPEQEIIRENMANEFHKLIQSILKHRVELKVERSKHLRYDPIIALIYPKKEYENKYIIRGKIVASKID